MDDLNVNEMPPILREAWAAMLAYEAHILEVDESLRPGLLEYLQNAGVLTNAAVRYSLKAYEVTIATHKENTRLNEEVEALRALVDAKKQKPSNLELLSRYNEQRSKRRSLKLRTFLDQIGEGDRYRAVLTTRARMRKKIS
ncbi:MAG: hypothetical protein WCI67_20940 [Chloroflexales bacterium]